MAYSGYLVISRDLLLNRISPVHQRVIAHHITYDLGEVVVPHAVVATVIGYAQNDFIQAAVVSVGSMTHQPRGHVLHITISLDPDNASPFDSVALINDNGYTPIDPFDIVIDPKVFS